MKLLHQEIILFQEVKPLHREATAIELKVKEMKHLEIFLKEVKAIEVQRFKEVLQAIEIYLKKEEIQAEAKKILDEAKEIQEETDEVKLRLNICGQKPM